MLTEQLRRKALTAALLASNLRRHKPFAEATPCYWDLTSEQDFAKHAKHLEPVRHPERKTIRGILGRFDIKSILDAGCGPATEKLNYAQDLKLKSAFYVGLDLSERMLTVAQRRLPKTPFVRGNLSDVPFQDKSFDAVVLRHILEHQPEGYEQIVRETVRVAKKCVIIDFFHEPLPLIPKILRINDERGLANNWYNRENFQDFLDSLPISGWMVTKCPGSGGQEAAIYTLLI